ncbi:MAG TPA: radical SAM/SPASM domain-containing protein, partial [Firmicutes bacterium]|nr:radical SAM/SPASM domain-containing protein [Bacillota bacterium]
MEEHKYIHLLYVPTMACNMACKYCYLEDNTKEIETEYGVLDTLKYSVNKFIKSNVVPFNISLHGGEVTTLCKEEFHDLIKYINDYYEIMKDELTSNGFRVGSPHIKTNLYNIKKHIDTIKEYNVSISGSLDLPLELHEEYRVTKGGDKTLNTILDNIKVLEGIPNKKKVSATIFKEHYKKIDEIIEDIKFLHKNTCLDMNDFNFMIGFDYNSNGILHHMSEEEQVEFYKRMHKEFDGTDLDYGVNGPWFDEFGPEYCTNCDNCGEKFFLLERNGDIYSCVRGQKNSDYYYGNIYK